MNYLKIISKAFLFAVCSLLILTFIFTMLNYFNFISSKVMIISKIVIPLFSLALGGYIMGKNAEKNGWFEGLKLGVIIVLLIVIFNLIFGPKLIFKDFVFYILLLVSCMFGAMTGINKKK